jgi:TPR repeat protein
MGDGVPKDLVQAYAWLLQATNAGNTQVAQTFDTLKRGLAPAQIEEARKRALAAR